MPWNGQLLPSGQSSSFLFLSVSDLIPFLPDCASLPGWKNSFAFSLSDSASGQIG